MADNPEFGRRLRDARREWERRHDRELTFEEIGERVAELIERPEGPFRYQTVARWFKGREPEALAHIIALASVLETDASLLAFGVEQIPASGYRPADDDESAEDTGGRGAA